MPPKRHPTGATSRAPPVLISQLNESIGQEYEAPASSRGRVTHSPPADHQNLSEDETISTTHVEASLGAMALTQSSAVTTAVEVSPSVTSLPLTMPSSFNYIPSGGAHIPATRAATTLTFANVTPLTATTLSTTTSQFTQPSQTAYILNQPPNGATTTNTFVPWGNPQDFWNNSQYYQPPLHRSDSVPEYNSAMAQKDNRIADLTKHVFALQHAVINANAPILKPNSQPVQPGNFIPPPVNYDGHQPRAPEPQHIQQQGQQQNLFRSHSPIARWRLRFDGTAATMPVENFLHRLDKHRGLDGTSDDYVNQNIFRMLSGNAEKWYWQFDKRYPNADWPTTRAALLRHFRGPPSAAMDDRIIAEMVLRKQGPKESVDDFYSEILELNNRLTERRSEAALIEIMKRNMIPRLSNAILSVPCPTLEDFRDCAQNIETHQLSQHQARHEARNIHELNYMEPDTDENTIEAFHRPMKHGRPIHNIPNPWVCWNCGKTGHGFRECLQELQGLFCFKCGHKGVRLPNCPKCYQENGRRSASHTGDSRQPQVLPVSEPAL